MDVTTLYNMVKSTADAATNAANPKIQPVHVDYMVYRLFHSFRTARLSSGGYSLA